MINKWEEIDKQALYNALLALKTCPKCRGELKPVALLENVIGCDNCKETWFIGEVKP